MEWKKAISALTMGIIVTSGTVGFSYSIQNKKVAPFVKVKRADVGLTGKTEMALAYDFANKIVSGTLERQDISGIGNSIHLPSSMTGLGDSE